jgi:hypothetical protein
MLLFLYSVVSVILAVQERRNFENLKTQTRLALQVHLTQFSFKHPWEIIMEFWSLVRNVYRLNSYWLISTTTSAKRDSETNPSKLAHIFLIDSLNGLAHLGTSHAVRHLLNKTRERNKSWQPNGHVTGQICPLLQQFDLSLSFSQTNDSCGQLNSVHTRCVSLRSILTLLCQ